MVRSLLVRGLLAGLIAGVFAFAFGYLVGEPPVRSAIAVEEAGGAAGHHDGAAAAPAEEEEELVSRDTQSTVGLATGILAYGVAVGGLFALVFAASLGRIAALGARGTAALLGAVAYVSVVLVPFLKYPANPPAVGDGDTIDRRTVTFLAMLVSSVLVAGLAAWLRNRLTERLGGWNATLAAGGGYAVVMLLVAVALPVIQEVPEGFPPALLWQFRTASLGTQLVLWTSLALVFGALANRLFTDAPAREALDRPAVPA